MRRLSRILTAAVLAACPLAAQPQPTGNAALDALSWMRGCWGSAEGAASADECWLDRRGDTMIGFHIDVFANGRVFFEFLRIVAEDDEVTYLASPKGSEPTPFRMTEIGERRVVFENPDHDWPQRLTYWVEDDELHARAEGLDSGSRQAEWVWARSNPN